MEAPESKHTHSDTEPQPKLGIHRRMARWLLGDGIGEVSARSNNGASDSYVAWYAAQTPGDTDSTVPSETNDQPVVSSRREALGIIGVATGIAVLAGMVIVGSIRGDEIVGRAQDLFGGDGDRSTEVQHIYIERLILTGEDADPIDGESEIDYLTPTSTIPAQSLRHQHHD